MIAKLMLGSVVLAGTLYAQPIIEHTAPEYLKPQYRSTLHVSIESSETYPTKRLYFKANDGANYNFVGISCDADACEGTLPKATVQTESLEYLFLVVDKEKKVYKTQKYTVAFKSEGELPPNQQDQSSAPLLIMSEMEKAPKAIEGFSDDMVYDTVESSARFGIVAGIYTQITASGATTAAATAGTTTATSGGTVAATTAATTGISTTTVIATGAAVVAGAGAAVALSGKESGASSNTTYDVTLQGDSGWSSEVVISGSSCRYSESSTTLRAAALPDEAGTSNSGSCSFNYDETSQIYTFETDSGSRFSSAPTAKDQKSFTLQDSNLNTLVFTQR